MGIFQCIEIDPYAETVKYVQKQLPDHWDGFHGSAEPRSSSDLIPRPARKGAMFHPEANDIPISIRPSDPDITRMYCMYYQDLDPKDEEAIQDKGFDYLRIGAATPEELAEERGSPHSSVTKAVGKAWIVGWESENKPGRTVRNLGRTIDVDLPLEFVRDRIVEWTSGILSLVPEFTCMLQERFEEPGSYELRLRWENRDKLYDGQWYDLTKGFQHVSAQMITFELDWDEIAIMTGKIPDNLNAKVRVAIFQTNTADLRQIDACTMAAHKIPQWVKKTLERHFAWTYIWSKTPERKVLLNGSSSHTEDLQ